MSHRVKDVPRVILEIANEQRTTLKTNQEENKINGGCEGVMAIFPLGKMVSRNETKGRGPWRMRSRI